MVLVTYYRITMGHSGLERDCRMIAARHRRLPWEHTATSLTSAAVLSGSAVRECLQAVR